MNYKFKFELVRTPKDPEKLVTPGIVWVGAGDHFWGMIVIGWWDFFLRLAILKSIKINPDDRCQKQIRS